MPTWGRGGAGNIVSDAQVKAQEQKIAEDLEANRSLTSSAAPPATSPSPNPTDYAHMGRGGAGNWFQPSDLSKTGTITSATDSTAAPEVSSKPKVSEPAHPEGMELPVARAGRGGAGNFVWRDGEREREREREEERRKEGVRESVERVVEEGLVKPGQAVLGGAKAGRGW